MRKLVQGENVDFEVDDALKIQVQRTDVGYVIDAYTVNPEDFITSMAVWDDDIEAIRGEAESILEEDNYEDEDF